MRTTTTCLVALAALAGCSKSGSLVFVTVDAAAPIADAARMHVALAAGGQSHTSDVTLTPATFPPAHSFAVDVSPGVTGSMSVQVTVFDSSGANVGEAAGSVAIAGGGRADLSLTLGGTGGGDDMALADLSGPDLAGTPPADLAWHQLTWTAQSITLNQFTAMWASDASHIFVCGDSSISCYVSSGDDMWTQKAANPFYRPGGMWGTSPTVLFFVGNQGDIRGWDAANNTWTQSAGSVSAGAVLTGIWGSSINDVYVSSSGNQSGSGEAIYHNTTGNLVGGTWTNPINIASGALNGISGTTGPVYAVGNNGRIFHSSDGSTWNTLTTGVPAVNLYGVFVLDAQHVYVVGDAGTILFSNGNGMFTQQTIASTYAMFVFRAVWAADADNVFAVGDKGAVLHGDHSGTWTAETSGLEVQSISINTVFGTSATNVYVAGDGGWVSHGK